MILKTFWLSESLDKAIKKQKEKRRKETDNIKYSEADFIRESIVKNLNERS